MIDETRQDLAAAYALDALNAAERRTFEAELDRDPELRALTFELLETTAALADDAPRLLPPPELRERLLASIRAEAAATLPAMTTPTPSTSKPTSGVGILPWAIAAGFLITSAALWFERDQWRIDSMDLRKEVVEARERQSTDESKINALKAEIKELRDRDALAQVRIATLSSQVAEFAKGSAVIVWDPANQRGVIRLVNLPRPEAGKDYQLWVIDPKYPNPVNGGVVPVGADGSARVSFTGDQPIEKADKFAISIEPTGGVPKATGPIVFLGE